MKKWMLHIFILISGINFMASGDEASSQGYVFSDSQGDPVVTLTSYDVSVVNFYPLGRYRDFSLVNFGISGQVNAFILDLEALRVFTSLNMSFNVTTTERMRSITDLYYTLGGGWTFSLSPLTEGLSVTPSLAYGWMPHFVTGDYYAQGESSFYLFSDQILFFQAEFAYDLFPLLDGLDLQLFITPGYILFLEEAYHGHELGVNLGVRIPFQARKKEKAPEPEPVFVEEPDNEAPLAGGEAALTISVLGPKEADISWETARDNETESSELVYEIYLTPILPDSKENLLSEGNRIAVKKGEDNTLFLDQLSPESEYYTNLLVRDEAGNRTLYRGEKFVTPAEFRQEEISPGQNAIEVDLEKVIEVPFNYDLNPATVNASTVTVHNGIREVDGEVKYDEKRRTVVFAPSEPYLEGTEHRVSLSEGIEDLKGQKLEKPIEFTFTTLKYSDIFAHWKFNNNTLDSSGNNHTATLRSFRKGPLPEFQTVDENGNYALRFYGGYNWGNYVDLGTIDMGNEFSIAGWVYIETPPEEYSQKIMTLISNGDAGAVKDGFKVFFNNWNRDDKRIVIESGNGTANRNTQTQPDFIAYNNWYHVAVVMDRLNGQVKLYFNGVEAETTNDGAVLNDFNTNAPLHIAQFKDGYFHYTGYIDDFRIYKKQLSAEEISIIARTK